MSSRKIRAFLTGVLAIGVPLVLANPCLAADQCITVQQKVDSRRASLKAFRSSRILARQARELIQLTTDCSGASSNRLQSRVRERLEAVKSVSTDLHRMQVEVCAVTECYELTQRQARSRARKAVNRVQRLYTRAGRRYERACDQNIPSEIVDQAERAFANASAAAKQLGGALVCTQQGTDFNVSPPEGFELLLSATDSDQDGLSDGQELLLGLDAELRDTDGDSVPDDVDAFGISESERSGFTLTGPARGNSAVVVTLTDSSGSRDRTRVRASAGEWSAQPDLATLSDGRVRIAVSASRDSALSDFSYSVLLEEGTPAEPTSEITFDGQYPVTQPQLLKRYALEGLESPTQAAATLVNGTIVKALVRGDDEERGAYFQLFNATGTALGEPQLATTDGAEDQSRTAVAALADGGFVVAWIDDEDLGLSEIGVISVVLRRFDSDGVATSSEQFVANVRNATDSKNGWLNVAAFTDGTLAIIYGNGGGGQNVNLTIMGADGMLVNNTPIVVNDRTLDPRLNQFPKYASVLDDTTIAVGWDSRNFAENSDNTVDSFIRFYDKQGVALSPQQQISPLTEIEDPQQQYLFADLARLPDGTYAALFETDSNQRALRGQFNITPTHYNGTLLRFFSVDEQFNVQDLSEVVEVEGYWPGFQEPRAIRVNEDSMTIFFDHYTFFQEGPTQLYARDFTFTGEPLETSTSLEGLYRYEQNKDTLALSGTGTPGTSVELLFTSAEGAPLARRETVSDDGNWQSTFAQGDLASIPHGEATLEITSFNGAGSAADGATYDFLFFNPEAQQAPDIFNLVSAPAEHYQLLDAQSFALAKDDSYAVVYKSLEDDQSRFGYFKPKLSMFDSNGDPIVQGIDVATTLTRPEDQLFDVTIDYQYQAGELLGVVVAWTSRVRDSNDINVYFQLFGPDGTKRMEQEALVNTGTARNQRFVSVASQENGTFLIVWGSNHVVGSDRHVYGQRYSADGTPLAGTNIDLSPSAGEFKISTTRSFQGDVPVGVVVLPNTDFMITYDVRDGASRDLYGQRFSKAGEPVGTEILLDENHTGVDGFPKLIALADGTYVAAFRTKGRWDTDIELRLYDENFVPLGDRFTQPFNTLHQQYRGHPAPLTVGDSTGFIVTWEERGPIPYPSQDYSMWYAIYLDGEWTEAQRLNTYTWGPVQLPIGAQRSDGTIQFIYWGDKITTGTWHDTAILSKIIEPDGTVLVPDMIPSGFSQ